MVTWLVISSSYLWQVWHGEAVTITEYTTGVATILGLWLGRETKVAYFKQRDKATEEV